MHFTLKNLTYTVTACIILVILGYFFIDKPIAYWVYQQQISNHTFLKWFSYIPALIVSLMMTYYLIFIIKYCKNQSYNPVLLAIANSVAITFFLKEQLKAIFGRTWPLTWTHNNPSLISDGVYGFNFFQRGDAYHSFPSGSTAVTVAALTIIGLYWPKSRLLTASIAALVVAGMIGMNYHFFSDIIAGAFLGAVVAICVFKASCSSNQNTVKE